MNDPLKLATNGGKPVRTKPWPTGPFHFKSEIERLKEVLSGPALPLARGKNVMEFRENIATRYGSKNVVTVSSGTAAIHVALAAAGVGPGDEVILSPLTDYGSTIGIFQLNANPVFCDVDPGSYCIDPEKLTELITARTKVIMAIHIAGYPCDMHRIMRIAKARRLVVIEDCAQSHLTKIGDQYAGTFGDFGCFSTNESKHMKTGEGGFILCNKERDAKYADLFADKCYPRFPGAPKTPSFPALNVRMSDITAAIGVMQFKNLPARIRHRNHIGTEMEKVISQYPLRPAGRAKKSACSYWWFAFHADTERTNITTEFLMKALRAEGIPCTNHSQRNAMQWEIFRKLDKNPNAFRTYRPLGLRKGSYHQGLPHAEWNYKHMLRFTLNEYVTSEEVRDIDRALNKVFPKRGHGRIVLPRPRGHNG